MRKIALSLLILGWAACSKPEDPAGPGGTALVTYKNPAAKFSCSVPAGWRVMEKDTASVTFFGPPAGQQPYSTMIAVYFYAKSGSEFASPEQYVAARRASGAQVGPVRASTWNGTQVQRFESTRRQPILHQSELNATIKEDAVLVPAKDGFFAVVHAAPEALFDQTREEFAYLLDSLSLAF